MPTDLLQKSFSLLMRRQTNILSAAFVIMATVVLSYILGLVKQRLLASIFGVSNVLGIQDYASLLPDTLFQFTIAAALSTAFIPVFSEYLARGKDREGYQMASTILLIGMSIFALLSITLFIFAEFFLQFFNLGGKFSLEEMTLMANLMRIFLFGQFLFIIGTFSSAVLQSYNHFFIPGIASALYNLGIIIGVLLLSSTIGIYSAPVGVILGSLIFICVQLPQMKKVGFAFLPTKTVLQSEAVGKILQLMWPKTISLIIFRIGTLLLAAFISLLPDPGRMNVVYNFAKILAFVPVALIGQTIAQAAFPVLAKQKNGIADFKVTFMTSFNQLLYLILPISVLILVLRIPIVRFAFGADKVDWEATLLIGQTLAYFSISIFAEALTALVLRGFYALHDTKIPLIVGSITTGVLIGLAYAFITVYKLGVDSIALAYSVGTMLQFIILFIILDRKVQGFDKKNFLLSVVKILAATIFTGFAIYIPIKLLDQLVFDTTRTINLLFLTGISSLAGFSLYVFLTWFFNVKEAHTFLLLFRKVGDWRSILEKREETIEGTRINP